MRVLYRVLAGEAATPTVAVAKESGGFEEFMRRRREPRDNLRQEPSLALSR